MELILASSSKYRAGLLERLNLAFRSVNAMIDESPLINELPADLAKRLAFEKAGKVHQKYSSSIVIGSDQVCAFDNTILGKPLTDVNAKKQLQTFSNKCITFFTAICVLTLKEQFEYTDITTVRFRELSDDEIERYIEIDQPLDCAGSFKAEGLGISLFESVESTDPTALIGLPMVKLSEFLRKAGLMIP